MVTGKKMAEIVSGEEKAWEMLSLMPSDDVLRRTGAVIDPSSGCFTVTSFGIPFNVDISKREITGSDRRGEPFLKRLGYFYRLSALWYLIKAENIRASGTLINPTSMKGGDIFFRGSHVLPLEQIAKKYARDREGFLGRGSELGGRQVRYGDAGIEIHPFPRIPATMILWLEDEEFPSRADLLFDSTAQPQLPLDIIWSVAMMTVLAFL